MRINEFKKGRKGKVLDTHQAATPGAYTSTNPDRYYGLYRASMLMAKYPDNLDEIDIESMTGNKAYIGPYTDIEREMVEKAYEKLGYEAYAMAKGPSVEMPDINTKSPVAIRNK